MSFEIAHESIEDSTPAYLYEFIVGSVYYRATSAANTHIVDTFEYVPHAGIRHTEVQNSGEDAKNVCTVTVSYDHPLASWLRQYIPTEKIVLIIKNYEIGEAPTHFEFQGLYMKYAAKYPEFKMTFSPLDYTLAQGALQKSYGLNCQHTQYDQWCGLVPQLFSLSTTIASYDPATDTISVTPTDLDGVAVDYYLGGYIELTGFYGKERAWIVSQTTFTLGLDRKMPSLAAGAAIDIVPSCKGSFEACRDPALFNNKLRYLGAPHANKVNPFGQTGVKGEV
ncbi:MAG: hypothetical protein DRP93_03065 [Candidatus Neomarinimicrobiota bacterium]|nr:MAG: hypothetical protein DRP93_03065 [Candidatus Neomarinimicrobiota bacterium]